MQECYQQECETEIIEQTVTEISVTLNGHIELFCQQSNAFDVPREIRINDTWVNIDTLIEQIEKCRYEVSIKRIKTMTQKEKNELSELAKGIVRPGKITEVPKEAKPSIPMPPKGD